MYNKAILIGRLVADPELNETPAGVPVSTFRIAVDRAYKNSDGEKQTDFIDIVAWRDRAEFVCNYFSKGKIILVEGQINTRNYIDKNDNKRTAVEVTADNLRFADFGAKKPEEKAAKNTSKRR